jgi:Predicted signal transduction protein with a C-terminal ATPase domain
MSALYGESPLKTLKQGPSSRSKLIDDEVISRFDILNLFGKEKLENIQTTIAKASGLALVILDYKGEAITEMTAFTPFCRKMRGGDKSAYLCRSADIYGSSQALTRQKKFIYFCPCGLLEVAIPIIVKNHYLGTLYAGQVRCDEAPKDIPRLGKMFEHELAECPLNASQKKMYRSIAVYEFERFRSLAELISLVSGQLCEQVMAGHLVSRDINHELTEAKEEIKRLETELKLKKSEVVKLKSRLNYYFLINTLNAISNLAVIEESPRTNEMIILFAEHLKHGLPVQKNFVLLSEEIENVERYLKMQKIRFGQLLNYTINISRDLAMRKVPVHVIMPFVERAVFSGLTTREAELHVTLTLSEEGQDVVIQVTDDGPGWSEEELAARFASFQNGYEGDAIQMAMAGARKAC